MKGTQESEASSWAPVGRPLGGDVPSRRLEHGPAALTRTGRARSPCFAHRLIAR